MYNMRTLPQSSRLNPAFQTGYNGHFGGLLSITPLFPAIDFSFNSNKLVYNDIIYPGTGEFDGSLIWAFNSQEEALKLVDKLEKINTFDLNLNLNLFNIGFKTKNIYWNIHAANKTFVNMAIPGGLIELVVKGNRHPDITPNMDLSGLGVNMTNYLEFGVGASMKVTADLTVGARFKALGGIANIESTKTDLHLNSHEDTLTLAADLQFRSSQPALTLDSLYYDQVRDTFLVDYTERSTSELISDIGYKFNNPGFAIDLGAEYQIMPELKAYVSITDIGFINWKTNVAEIRSADEEFIFQGFDIQRYIDDNNPNTTEPNMGEEYQDSLLTLFDVKKTNTSSYKTWLPAKLYVGASYNLTDAIGFGALYRGVYYNGDMQSAISLSANVNTNHISATVSYTMMEDNMDNIGLGFAGRFGPFQTFIISDHVLEEFWPQTARDVNIRLGFNWIFGYKKDKAALIE
ncbi:MAG: hypothetical protein C0599_13630 [Salinivirgaceae bacterium]|nr:MAG: hypothetical protein C0599_13630 [Salinivirgaceae bacterium]